MIKPSIADAGVIVAYLDKRDKWHEWTMNQMRFLPLPFTTCEPVITEACFLVAHLHNGTENVLKLVAENVVQIDFSLSAEIEEVKALMKKYENVPMSLADGCLVRMCEIQRDAKFFTLDGDFTIYRKNGRQPIPLI